MPPSSARCASCATTSPAKAKRMNVAPVAARLPAIDADERRRRDAVARFLERLAHRGVHQRFAGLQMARRLIETDTVTRLFLDQQERAVADDNRRDGHGRSGQLVFTHGVGVCIVSRPDGKKAGSNPCLPVPERAKPAECPASSRYAYFFGAAALSAAALAAAALSAPQPCQPRPSCPAPPCRQRPSCRQPPCRPPPSCRRPSCRQRPSCRPPSCRRRPSCPRPSCRRPSCPQRPSRRPSSYPLRRGSHRRSSGRRGAAAGAIALAGGVAGAAAGAVAWAAAVAATAAAINATISLLIFVSSVVGLGGSVLQKKLTKPLNYKHFRLVLQSGCRFQATDRESLLPPWLTVASRASRGFERISRSQELRPCSVASADPSSSVARVAPTDAVYGLHHRAVPRMRQ